MERTGIVIFDLVPMGTFRLDAGGLRVIRLEESSTAAFVDSQCREAFTKLDGTHILPQEAVLKLPALFSLPEANLRVISVEDSQPLAKLPKDAIA